MQSLRTMMTLQVLIRRWLVIISKDARAHTRQISFLLMTEVSILLSSLHPTLLPMKTKIPHIRSRIPFDNLRKARPAIHMIKRYQVSKIRFRKGSVSATTSMMFSTLRVKANPMRSPTLCQGEEGEEDQMTGLHCKRADDENDHHLGARSLVTKYARPQACALVAWRVSRLSIAYCGFYAMETS